MVGPDVELDTRDSKMERIHSFSTFTKASERFRKFKKITRLCVMFWGARGEKPKQILCRGKLPERSDILKETLKLNKTWP